MNVFNKSLMPNKWSGKLNIITKELLWPLWPISVFPTFQEKQKTVNEIKKNLNKPYLKNLQLH